jgi:hypothetical protein
VITLALDCLLLQNAAGEYVPFTPEMVSAECAKQAACDFEPEFLTHTANAVCHYFKHELGRQAVTIEELSVAMTKALSGFSTAVLDGQEVDQAEESPELDLGRLAMEAGEGGELLFFPRLRHEIRRRLQHRPRILRLCGLRGCVKRLAGARRWGLRCRSLEEQVVSYLRQCLSVEPGRNELALVVQ